MAQAINVHPSYITRIFNGSTAITPDQAVGLAKFWRLKDHEKEYFLWLVLKSRSTDASMRDMADKK